MERTCAVDAPALARATSTTDRKRTPRFMWQNAFSHDSRCLCGLAPSPYRCGTPCRDRAIDKALSVDDARLTEVAAKRLQLLPKVGHLIVKITRRWLSLKSRGYRVQFRLQFSQLRIKA